VKFGLFKDPQIFCYFNNSIQVLLAFFQTSRTVVVSVRATGSARGITSHSSVVVEAVVVVVVVVVVEVVVVVGGEKIFARNCWQSWMSPLRIVQHL